MNFSQIDRSDATSAEAVFRTAFSLSEGPQEGALIGSLAHGLLTDTAQEDIFAFAARDGDDLTGCIIFSRLTYPNDTRSAFVLGPVAVMPDRQGQGTGQQLIAHGLFVLRGHGVDIAFTYGDPAFYCRVGFEPVDEDRFPAPFKLTYPEGWLGQSLTDATLKPLTGPAHCVTAFHDPQFW